MSEIEKEAEKESYDLFIANKLSYAQDRVHFETGYIKGHKAATEWISTDTPPKDDRLVLLICTNWVGLNDSEQFYLGEYHNDSECWISQDGDEIHNPCFWNDFVFIHPIK